MQFVSQTVLVQNEYKVGKVQLVFMIYAWDMYTVA